MLFNISYSFSKCNLAKTFILLKPNTKFTHAYSEDLNINCEQIQENIQKTVEVNSFIMLYEDSYSN